MPRRESLHGRRVSASEPGIKKEFHQCGANPGQSFRADLLVNYRFDRHNLGDSQ